MYCLSMVTLNRRSVLEQTLPAIIETTRQEAESEGVQIFVTDNGSTDGTPELLREMEAEGKIKAWCLSDNLGTEMGRNVHFTECMGHHTLRIDDKVLPLAAGWLTALKVQSERNHAIVAPPYDPSLAWMSRVAPALEYIPWPHDHGMGGPLIFIPAEAMNQLGGCDEVEGMVYGWGDCLYIQRAMLLGWNFGFALHVPFKFMAKASPERRAKAMEYHPLYVERMRQYQEAERDVFIPLETTVGYRAGLEARG